MTLWSLVALVTLALVTSPYVKRWFLRYRYRDRVIDSLIQKPAQLFTQQDDSLRKAADERRLRADKASKEAVRIRTRDEDRRIRLVG